MTEGAALQRVDILLEDGLLALEEVHLALALQQCSLCRLRLRLRLDQGLAVTDGAALQRANILLHGAPLRTTQPTQRVDIAVQENHLLLQLVQV